MKYATNEWFVKAPWGKIAVISWGEQTGQRVFLLHGRQDSAATFQPLLELLPDRGRYYVAIDLPGHGKSDPLPVGVAIARLHFLGAMELVLKDLQWDKFCFMGHSMGCEMGLFYNVLYPGQIQKMILIDGGPALERLQVREPEEYYKLFFANYYDNYDKYNNDNRVYTKRKALSAVMAARGLSEEQAEIVLSRNLIRIGNDQYKLSWDRRLRFPVALNFNSDFYYELFTKNSPPTLLIKCKQTVGVGYDKAKDDVENLLVKWEKSVKNFIVKPVDGDHDVHLKHPERIVKNALADHGEMARLCGT